MPRLATALTTTEGTRPHRVAIIGGGIAGLSCAQHLSSSSSSLNRNILDVTVFDTGRLRPGGRMSSRLPGDRPKEQDDKKNDPGLSPPPPTYQYLSKCIVDHAAQLIPLPQLEGNHHQKRRRMQEFVQQVRQWEAQGVVQPFPKDSLWDIVAADSSKNDASFQLEPFPKDIPVFHGTKGNGRIPVAMAKHGNFKVVQDVWVSPSNGVRYLPQSQQWKVQASGQVLGYFDTLIIAHNGKCADRLMSKTPAKKVHNLLKVNFAASAPREGGKRMTLNSLYSLSFAVSTTNGTSVVSQALPEPFVAGTVCNEPCLKFLTCQTRKYPSAALDQDHVEIWTVLSSATFAKKHMAPQEFLPPHVVEHVTGLLLESLERSLGLESSSIQPLESRLQLWGAAVPLNVWHSSPNQDADDAEETVGFLYDSEFAVGVCGDWLLQPSIAGAWTSGQRLAQHLLSCYSHSQEAATTSTTDSFRAADTVGLQGRFVRSPGAHASGIASFEDDNDDDETQGSSVTPVGVVKEPTMTTD